MRPSYTRCMPFGTCEARLVHVTAIAAAFAFALVACDGGRESSGTAARPEAGVQEPATGSPGATGDAPDTSSMGEIVLEKINANPAIEGKATLVEFRQKSISTQALGDSLKSAVVEFEGAVTFSSDVQWSWQGPTKAGEPAKFEASAEYVNQGKGWELMQPIGIYPL